MKKILILVTVFLTLTQQVFSHPEENKVFKLNTSNQGKFEEFKRLFGEYGYELEATQIDIREVDADAITVIAHKASQVESRVIVEDTSLDVEGADVGINVRWLLDHLPEYVGRRATWGVLLAYWEEDTVFIYQGEVTGTIVNPRGSFGFGFDPVFLPDGSQETLAESKPNKYNARAKAVKALVEDDLFMEHDLIHDWDGPWQNSR